MSAWRIFGQVLFACFMSAVSCADDAALEAPLQTDYRKWDVFRGREARLVDRERDWLRFEERSGQSNAVPVQAIKGEDLRVLSDAYREQLKRQLSPEAKEYLARRNLERDALIREVGKGLRDEDFDALEGLAKKLRENYQRFRWETTCSDLELFYRILGDHHNGPDEHLQHWLDKHPTSKTAHLATAYRQISNGWRARGQGTINTVTPEGFQTFEQCIERARELLEKAKELEGDDPDLYRQLIEVAKTQAWPREQTKEIVQDLMKKFPKYASAHQGMGELLLPRWGGAPGELEEYAERIADEIGGADGQEVYGRIALRVAKYIPRQVLFDATQFRYTTVRAGLLHSIEQSPDDLLLVNTMAVMAIEQNDPETALDCFARLHKRGDPFEATLFVDLREYRRCQRWAELAKNSSAISTLVPSNHATRLVQYVDEDALISIGGRDKNDDRMTAWRGSVQQPLPYYALDYPLEGAINRLCSGSGVFVTAGTDEAGKGRLVCWTHQGMQQMRRLEPWTEDQPITDLAVALDGKQAAFITGDKQVGLRQLKENGDLASIELDRTPTALAYGPDNQSLAVGCTDGTCQIWNTTTLKREHEIKRAGEPIYRITYIPHDKRLCIAQSNGAIYFWEPDQSKLDAAEFKSANDLRDLAISPDGQLLATAHGAEKVVIVTSLKNLQEVARFTGHRAEVESICFSPSGRTLASGSIDGSVRIWDCSDRGLAGAADRRRR